MQDLLSLLHILKQLPKLGGICELRRKELLPIETDERKVKLK